MLEIFVNKSIVRMPIGEGRGRTGNQDVYIEATADKHLYSFGPAM